ncbi:MAG TPA: hypothetical protein VJ741_09940 [Solirubrobacteraceae bacterium]|nr:hypothetical protein [Solirubrobacteraceae bacterium]
MIIDTDHKCRPRPPITAFLLSDEAPFITGGVYPVDGGELA